MTTFSNMPKTHTVAAENKTTHKTSTDTFQETGAKHFDNAKSLIFPKITRAKFLAFAQALETDYQFVFWAAFKLLIFRLSLQKQIDLHIPSANHKPKMAGNDAKETPNFAQLQTNISEQIQFTELLQKVSSTYQKKFPTHQSLSKRDPKNHIYFFYTFPSDAKEANPVSQHTVGPEQASLRVSIKNTNDAINVTIAYNTTLHEGAYIHELLQQYLFLIEQIIEHPAKNILDYSLVTSEARQILPDPKRPLIKQWTQSIPELITQQAQTTPLATALVDGQHQWSYAELETFSNRIGNYLLQVSVGKKDVVAVLASREASLAAAILGILKAGAAFMILDPSYPSGRLLKQLTIGRPKAFLHLEGAGELPPELNSFLNHNPCHYVRLPKTANAVSGPFATVSTDHPEVPISPKQLAYIAFTSGSTGEPKGILGSHLPLAHFFPWHINKFGLQRSDKFSMLSGLSHDPILRDMFTPLCLGATLFIPSQSSLFDSEKLFNWLSVNEINVLHLTPSLSRVIITRALSENQRLPHVRYAFFGGEKLEHEIVQDFSTVASNVTCINFYGATETPQAMAYHVVKRQADLKNRRRIPLGQGIANVQLLILNKNKQLAGIHELGEIYIRTPYLSEGYLGDPSLTKEKFLSNPFTDLPDDLLYKTGDLGRYRSDGLINFFDRKDQQINIRGFRIELGEIRHTLGQFPAIYNCHIDIKETADSKQIVAFYRAEKPIRQEELKSFLKSHLPYYMIPVAYIFVEEYPRTPNGKIDKRKLLSLADKQILDHSNFVAAKTENEKLLVEIWRKLLNINSPGVHDDFFDLGGHSILAVEMLIQVRKVVGVEISPNELFPEATIHHICKLIDAAVKGDTAVSDPRTFKSLISVHPAGKESLPNLFCVHGGGGNILFLKEWKKHLETLNMPVYGFQARGIDGISQPHSSIEEMAHDYLQEMREYQPSGPYFIAGYSGGGSIALEIATILRNRGEEVPVVLLLDSYHPDVQNRRLTVMEHLQNALEYPLHFVYQRVARQFEQIQMRLRVRKLKDILERKQQVPLELRDLYISSHLSAVRQKHKIESYEGPVILYRATEVWQVYDHIGQDLGWGDTLKNLKIVDVEGDHDDLIREPNVGSLLQQISEAINSRP